MAAHGGYAFRQRGDGSYDARDVGVANAGALVGAQLLDRLVREGLMPAGSGYPEMEAAMGQGRVAMMINGPWAWVNLQRVGIDFGVARIPAVAGKPAVPYVGIKGVLVNRASRSNANWPPSSSRTTCWRPTACARSTAPSRSARRRAAPTTRNWPATR
jgi:maltose/maltodextrin transport system substrate-binding protein